VHLSHSSLDVYNKCQYKFKLRYIDKIPYDKGNIYSSFGNAIHNTLKDILLSKNLDTNKTFLQYFKDELKKLSDKQKKLIFNDKDKKILLQNMLNTGAKLCELAIEELEKKFPNYQIIMVEGTLSEPLLEICNTNYEFKGIIDLVIKTPDEKYHIIDWKSTSWGWKPEKKVDKIITYQLTLYKHFFRLKEDINFEDIDTYFALLKRTAKKKPIEIFEVKAGKKKVRNSLNVINNMIESIEKNHFPKNKLSCEYCDYRHTLECP